MGATIPLEAELARGGGLHFERLFGTFGVRLPGEVAPTIRLGMGPFRHPESCDVLAGGRTGAITTCGSETRLGASVRIGIAWPLSSRVLVGPELG